MAFSPSGFSGLCLILRKGFIKLQKLFQFLLPLFQKSGLFILIPRFTRSVCLREEKPAIYELYEYIAQDPVRNELIAGDVRQALAEDHTCAVFVRLKSHAATLARDLEGSADHLFLIYGDSIVMSGSSLSARFGVAVMP